MTFQTDKHFFLVNFFPFIYRAKWTGGIAKMNSPTYLFRDFISVEIIYESDCTFIPDQHPNTG
jgi:hypothetical protein